MDKRNIESIIEQLDDEWKDAPSYFGIYKSNTSSSEENDVYILANNQGIIRFARCLLESIATDDRDEKGFSKIDCSELVEEGDFNLNYIKTLDDDGDRIEELKDKETFKDKIYKYGCFGILLLIIVNFVWGLISILKMIYNFIF